MKKINQIANKIIKNSIFAYITLIACIVLSIILLSREIGLINKSMYIFIIEFIAAFLIYNSGKSIITGSSYLTNRDIFEGLNKTNYLIYNNKSFLKAQRFYAISFMSFIVIHIYLVLWTIIVSDVYSGSIADGILKCIYRFLYTTVVFWLPSSINFILATKNMKEILIKLDAYTKMEKDIR